MITIKAKDVDGFIATYPKNIQVLLKELRATIKKAAPKAEEVISYNIPAYKQYGMLVYFAAYKNHIGFYPTPSGVSEFKKELAAYKVSTGAIQFPYDKPLPLSLITKIVKFRVMENTVKEKSKNE